MSTVSRSAAGDSTASPARGRTAPRRRGDALTGAIYRAVLDELARTSLEDLSFDKIAPVAGTGKAALYRRWSTPAELVMAALNDPAAGFGQVPAPPGTGTLRGDLIAILAGLAGALGEPRGRALRPLIAQRHQHPELFGEVHRRIIEPHQQLVRSVLRDAVGRGEARPGSDTMRIASVGPRLIIMESWERTPIDASEVAAIVDEILIPLVSPSG